MNLHSFSKIGGAHMGCALRDFTGNAGTGVGGAAGPGSKDSNSVVGSESEGSAFVISTRPRQFQDLCVVHSKVMIQDHTLRSHRNWERHEARDQGPGPATCLPPRLQRLARWCARQVHSQHPRQMNDGVMATKEISCFPESSEYWVYHPAII